MNISNLIGYLNLPVKRLTALSYWLSDHAANHANQLGQI